ncbi:hypothetical protein Clacol_009778 [Clathrus columnatus]|uniref:F-box domain-containing protein n=1 Tax=Clathrus columnatus TaxID=1419009 RepID=A0AAV5ARW0_9AGAM|nr:hypothetical protein Clacol_009778 [Clathrus columnatus]
MKLPVELLDIIIDNITETSTLFSLGLTCKHFAGVILPNHLLYHTICGRVEQTQLWNYLVLNPNVCRYIRRLEVTEMYNPTMRLSSHIYDIDPPQPGNLSPLLWSYELIARALHQMINLKALEWNNAETPIFHAESDIGKKFSNLCFLGRMPGSPFSFRRMPLNGRWPNLRILALSISYDHSEVPTTESIKDFISFHSNIVSLEWHISLRRSPRLSITSLPPGCLPHLRALDADKELIQSLIATACIPPRPLKKIINFPTEAELWEQPEISFQGINKPSLRVVSLAIRSLSQLTSFGDMFPNVECIDVGNSVSTGLWDEDLRHFRIPLMATERLSCLKNLRVILGVQFLHESMEDEENKDRLEWVNQLFPYVEFCADRSSGIVLTRRNNSISWKWVDIPLWSKYLGREEDFTIPEERDHIAL